MSELQSGAADETPVWAVFGDLMSALIAGARHGTALLWVIALGAVLKFALNEGVARWQLATGGPIYATPAIADDGTIVGFDILLGNRVSIGPNVVMRNVRVGDDAVILANCVIEDAVIGAGSAGGNAVRMGSLGGGKGENEH